MQSVDLTHQLLYNEIKQNYCNIREVYLTNMARLIRYLEDGIWKYASVKDVGELANLKTTEKSDLVSAINDLYENGTAEPIPPEFAERVGNIEIRIPDLDEVIAEVVNKADLTYVDGELTKKVDSSVHQTQYDEIKGNLLDKVDLEEHQSKYDEITSNLANKVDSLNFNDLKGRVETVETDVVNIEGEVSTKISKTEFDDAVGVDKWVASKYPLTGTDLNQTPPSFPLIKGLVATQVETVEDGMSLPLFVGDNIITHFFTNVKVKVAKTINLNFSYDSSIGIYMNGAKMYENVDNGGVSVNLSLPLRAGWNTIEILHGHALGIPMLNLGIVISDNVDKLTTVIGVGDKNETRLSQAETQIKQTQEAIELKANQTEISSLGNRIEQNESSITLLSDEIESKVSQTDFNAYSQRLSTAESSITQQADQIASKVAKTEYDLLNNRVGTAESTITQHTNQIQSKVSQTDFNALNGRVGSAESTITQHTNQIALKASQDDLDTVEGRLATAESSLTVQAGQIQSKVSQTEFNDVKGDVVNLDSRVSSAETSITQTANAIILKADKDTTYTKTEINGQMDAVNLKISDANTAITQTNDRINLKANSTDVYTKTEANNLLSGKTDNSTFNALVSRVSTAETEIDQTSDAINLKANATDVYTKAQTDTELGKKANQTDVSSIQTSVNDMASDLKVTPLEKNLLKIDWDKIKAEYAQVLANAQVATVAVSTTAFTNAYNALNGTTPKIEAEILASLTTTYTYGSTALRDTFKTKLTTYFTELEKIRKAINDKVNATANTANSTANTANNTANTANATANTANSTANTLKDTTIPALVTRVTTAESALTVQADAIAQKVSQTDFNTLNGRVTSAEGSITTLAGQISSKVSQVEVDTSIAGIKIGGRNFLANSDFSKQQQSYGSTSMHSKLEAVGYGGYNGGITNPTTSYHAHLDTGTFGLPVYEFNESDGNRNWKAVTQTLGNSLAQTGDYTISFDVYATGAGTKLFGGFYYTKVGGTTETFHAGQFNINVDSLNKWSRVSAKTTLGSDVDFNKSIKFYIYGYGFTTNSILYMKKPQLEIGKLASDWSPSVEDIEARVSDLKIGGTNLLYNSTGAVTNADGYADGWTDGTLVEFIEGKDTIVMANPLTGTMSTYSSEMKLKPNTKYSIRALIKSSTNSRGLSFKVLAKKSNSTKTGYDFDYSYPLTTTVHTDKLTEKYWSFTTDSDVSSGFIQIENTGNSLFVTDPTVAPTLSILANSASTFVDTTTTFYVKYTWENAEGESKASPESQLSVAKGNNFRITIPAFATRATKAKVYIGTETGVNLYQGDITTSAGSLTLSTPIATDSALAPSISSIYSKVWFSEIKIEEGDKSTSWSSSDEEIRARFTSITTRLSQAEQVINEDSIVSTVMSSTTFSNLLGNKADATALSGYATTGQLTDAQKAISNDYTQKIKEIDFKPYVTTTQMKIELGNVTTKFQSAGGVNLLKNSVGFAGFDQWEASNPDTTTRIVSHETLDVMGYGSGFNFQPHTATQTLRQTVDLTGGVTYTLSWKVEKKNETQTSDGTLFIQFRNEDRSVTYKGTSYDPAKKTEGFVDGNLSFTPTETGKYSIIVYAYKAVEATMTGFMLNVGEFPLQWTMAHGEIYNTAVKMDMSGIKVSKIENAKESRFTVMTPDRFAGYYDVNGDGIIDDSEGSPDEVFKMDDDEFIMKKAVVREEISMGNIKIININSASSSGWAFVPTTD